MSNRIGTFTVFRDQLNTLSKSEIWTSHFKVIFPRRKRPNIYRKSTKQDLIEFLMNYREVPTERRVRRTLLEEEKKEDKKETKAQKEKRANLLIINNLLDEFKVVNRENIIKHINKATNPGLKTIINKLLNIKERGLTPIISLNYIQKYKYVEPENWINRLDIQPIKEEKNIKIERKTDEVLLSYKVYSNEIVKRGIQFYYINTNDEYKGKDYITIKDNNRKRYFTGIRHEKGRPMYTSNSPLLRQALDKKRKYLNNTTSWEDFLDEVSDVENGNTLKNEPFLNYEWEVFIITKIDFAINVKGVPKSSLLKEPNRDTGNSVLHHTEFMDITLNKQATTLEDLFKPNISDYIIQNQTNSSCGLDCIIQTFKEGYDNSHKKSKQTLTYESLRKFFAIQRLGEEKEDIPNIELARIRIDKLLDEYKLIYSWDVFQILKSKCIALIIVKFNKVIFVFGILNSMIDALRCVLECCV